MAVAMIDLCPVSYFLVMNDACVKARQCARQRPWALQALKCSGVLIPMLLYTTLTDSAASLENMLMHAGSIAHGISSFQSACFT